MCVPEAALTHAATHAPEGAAQIPAVIVLLLTTARLVRRPQSRALPVHRQTSLLLQFVILALRHSIARWALCRLPALLAATALPAHRTTFLHAQQGLTTI